MRKSWRLVVIVALGAIGSQSCGSDPNPAVAKCQTFLTTVCTRVADCAVQAGTITQAQRQTQYDSCISQVGGTLMCGKAVAVGATYDQCITDLNAATCAVVNDPNTSLPTSCLNVIQERA
jgi:hypothetical protein